MTTYKNERRGQTLTDGLRLTVAGAVVVLFASLPAFAQEAQAPSITEEAGEDRYCTVGGEQYGAGTAQYEQYCTVLIVGGAENGKLEARARTP